ncbi:MAG TPA: FkbM family methyltransferase [Burkholderiales bacterium]|nr:FkbM family methyltransferase [Burkholderiales bacterium]
MRIAQRALLLLYRAIRRTGILATAPGRSLFESGYWAYKSLLEARDIEHLRPYVTPGTTVIDVGANIGFFAVRFARWVGDEGRVIAIEPESVNFDSLCTRVQQLGLRERVIALRAAAIERSGEVRLALNPDHPADHRVAESGIAVPGLAIDDVMAERGWPRVSLIKVDVQGSELRVIRGARTTLERWGPTLYVEFHEPSLREAGTSSQELLRELLALGYSPSFLDKHATWRLIDAQALDATMKARGYLDVLLVPARGALAH